MLHKGRLRFDQEDTSDPGYNSNCEKRPQRKFLLFQEADNGPEQFKIIRARSTSFTSAITDLREGLQDIQEGIERIKEQATSRQYCCHTWKTMSIFRRIVRNIFVKSVLSCSMDAFQIFG